MPSARSIYQRNTSLCDLHPVMRPLLLRLIAATVKQDPFPVGEGKGRFAFFEGYRSPERQAHLLSVARTTKAGPWKSSHQYGLAADFAVLIVKGDNAGTWSWSAEAPWGSLKALARLEQLDIPIAWDRGHVQHPIWEEIRRVL